jgi:hypothetical protein
MHLVIAGPVGEVAPDIHVADDAFAVDREDRRPRDLAVGVPDAVTLADVAVGIGEQRVGQEQFLDQRLILLRRVDRNAVDLGSGIRERFVCPGIADQLPVAVRSPVAAVEDEHQRRRSRQAHAATGCVRQRERWRAFSGCNGQLRFRDDAVDHSVDKRRLRLRLTLAQSPQVLDGLPEGAENRLAALARSQVTKDAPTTVAVELAVEMVRERRRRLCARRPEGMPDQVHVHLDARFA